MYKKTLLLSICAASTLSLFASENLGTISVDSTTIDDKFERKSSEISNTTTISGKEVDSAHAESIQQILQKVTGISAELQSGDSIKIHIRGVENQRYMGEKPGVAVVIDGVPVFERTGRVNIDLDNIESIKVIKGGASYLFGEDALSGAIIITTKRGAKYDDIYSALETGSFGYKKGVARVGFSDEKYSGHIQVSHRESDGYWDSSDYKSQYINGKFQYYIDDMSDVILGAEYSHREKDSHGTVGGMSEAKENPQSDFRGDPESRDYARMFDVNLLKVFATYSRDIDANSNFLFNIYRYGDETQFVSSPQKLDESGKKLTTYEDDAYVYDNLYDQVQMGAKSEYRISAQKYALMVGGEARANNYENSVIYRVDQAGYKGKIYKAGTERSNDTTDESIYGAYGEVKVEALKDLILVANLRVDSIGMDYESSITNDALTKDFTVFSHRIGATYKINENANIYANRSSGFRTPTMDQLFAGKVSTWGETISNPDLKIEESISYEIGVRGEIDLLDSAIGYDAAIFQIERDDYIMESTGQYSNAESIDKSLISQYQNIGGMRSRGFELSLNSDYSKRFSFSTAYSYIDSTFTKYDNFYMILGDRVMRYDLGGNDIPRVSNHNLNIALNYKLLPTTLLTTEINAKSDYYADELNAIKIAGYGTLNLLLSHDEKIYNNSANFFVRIDNVLDRKYYNTARASSDRNSDGIFNGEDLSLTVNPGVVFTAGISMKF